MKTTGNKVLDELLQIMINRFEDLVERGFLAPHFLQKMISDPKEILQFLRQNRAVVGEQLKRKLDPTLRATPQMLEQQGLVPQGYLGIIHKKYIYYLLPILPPSSLYMLCYFPNSMKFR